MKNLEVKKDLEKLEAELFLFEKHLHKLKTKGSHKPTDKNISGLLGVSQISLILLLPFDAVVSLLEEKIRTTTQIIVHLQGKLLGML